MEDVVVKIWDLFYSIHRYDNQKLEALYEAIHLDTDPFVHEKIEELNKFKLQLTKEYLPLTIKSY